MMLNVFQSWKATLAISATPIISMAFVAPASLASPQVSIEQSAQIARFAYAQGIIQEIELKRNSGRLVWNVDFTDDTELEIDASTGQVIKVDYEDDDADPRLDPRISLEQAVTIARLRVPNSYIQEAKLETDEGRLIWEIEFANDVEVEIDANSGTVLDVD